MILAGDIGGTKTNLAAFDVATGKLQLVVKQTYPSREHATLEEIITAFLSKHSLKIDHACFGIAGPVRAGRVEATNLAWVVEDRVLAREIGIVTVQLINDLEATAHGIATRTGADLVVLNPGAAQTSGNVAVIAAGTGLGEAGAYWDGTRLHPFACEGGHSDFAARNPVEVELFAYLHKKFGHVAWERVLSGPGLVNVYEFLRDSGRGQETPELAEQMRQNVPAAVISQAALAKSSQLCDDAVELFVTLYGAEAGNLALKLMATGGVYIGGGIAPHLIERLKMKTFLDAFAAKGRMEPLMRSMPVRVLMNPETALWGAAYAAALEAGLLK